VATGSVQAVHRPLLFDSYRPDARVRVLSIYRGASVVGLIAAPLLVAATAAAGFTWRAVFVVLGVVSLGAAAASLRLRDPGFGRLDAAEVRAAVRREETGVADDARLGDYAEPRLTFFEGIRRLFVLPTVGRLLAAWATLGAMVFPLVTYAFFFLDERWNVGPSGRALFFAAAWAGSIPALAWFGTRGEDAFRRDPARLVRLTAGLLVVAGTGIAVAAASPVFVVTLVAFAVVFAAAATLPPALSMLLLSIVPPRLRAHASALAGIFLTGVGGIGGLLLLGGIDRRFGIDTALFLLAVPCLVAALVVRSARTTIGADLDRMVDEIIEREEIGLLQASGGHVPMLACRRLDFSYGQVQVLFDVDFTVDDGEMVALLGTNGAGKSTLLRVISGLGLPSRGSVHYCGSDITFLDAERRVGLGITQVPGGRAVFGPMSVVDNLRVFGFSHGRDRTAVERGIDAAFDAFPRLAERRDALASTLSGGEQQMLGLGKAFILRPRVLLIDELSLGLAPKIVAELLEMVRRINAAGAAIVLVEQSVNIALSVVEHAYFMEKGEIRFDGRAADLLGRRDLLRSVFLEGAAR
jgi:ABC-type branched-subunit amino acid transport system ATPase component